MNAGPAPLLEGWVTEAEAAALRERLRPRLQPFHRPDRGRYAVDDSGSEAALCAHLAARAAAEMGLPLVPVQARWQRFMHGDYALMLDDACRWPGLSASVELVLDISAAGSDEAQVVYTGPEGTLWVPQQPGAAALIDRRSPLTRYDRYLSQRVGNTEVFRLSLALASVTPPTAP